MEYNKVKYLKYRLGQKIPNVLVDAVHAQSPNSDLFTGEIADIVTKSTGSNCIIATVSRNEADLNRPPENSGNPEAIYEYRNTINKILQTNELLDSNDKLKCSFLHIAVHGMKNSHALDVEVGTVNANSCQPAIKEWIIKILEEWSQDFKDKTPKIGADQHFSGDKSKKFHRTGDDKDYQGYGLDFNTLQIEFSHWLRSDYKNKVVNILVNAVNQFNSLSLNK